MVPVYYFVCVRSEHRDPKKRLSFELLTQVPATAAENAPGAAYELLAIDAAKSVLRGRLSIRTQWNVQISAFEGLEIPRTTPKLAENGCRVWTLKSP
jgi:hypothetical protein